MFENFTDEAKAVLQRSREYARADTGAVHDTEHVLLGLLTEEPPRVAATVLKHLGIDKDHVLLALGNLMLPKDPPNSLLNQYPITDPVRMALNDALQIARSLGSVAVGPEHILLGLLAVGENHALVLLERLGARPNDIRESVLRVLGVDASTIGPAYTRHPQ
jgi:ATP-dependent Clp protease ATP-binding subunit ClpC